MLTEKKRREIIAKTKKNLIAFRKIILAIEDDEVASAPFHYEWSDILLNDNEHYAIEGFRESAKTSYILRSFPLYCIAYPAKKRDYIVIIKANATLAQGKLKEIEREALSNPAIKSQIINVVEESSERFSIDVHNGKGGNMNIVFEAYGKGASIRGLSNQDRRPKIVIIDDPQDLEDARSDSVTENDWKWFLSDVMFLGKKTRIFIIGNNLGERCILERIFTNKDQLGFKTLKVPILNADGQSAWPEMFSVAAIEAERENYRKMGRIDNWLREKMCEAVSEETRIFKKEDHRYYAFNTLESFIGRCRIKATLDPASSTEKESCFRAIVVKATDSDGNWFILDVPFGRWDSAELINQIFTTVKKWRLKDFGIEKGIFHQVLEPFIIKEQRNRQVFFNVIPLEHAKQGTKLERIKLLQPRFKAHTIYFPMDAEWLSEMESELAGVTKDEIKSMYIDLVDALAMHEQIDEKPYYSSSDSVEAGIFQKVSRQVETEYDILNH